MNEHSKERWKREHLDNVNGSRVALLLRWNEKSAVGQISSQKERMLASIEKCYSRVIVE